MRKLDAESRRAIRRDQCQTARVTNNHLGAGSHDGSTVLFCRECSEASLEYRPCWKTHRARVCIEVKQALAVPDSLVLNLPYTLAYYGICGRIPWPVSLVRGEELVVDHAL